MAATLIIITVISFFDVDEFVVVNLAHVANQCCVQANSASTVSRMGSE